MDDLPHTPTSPIKQQWQEEGSSPTRRRYSFEASSSPPQPSPPPPVARTSPKRKPVPNFSPEVRLQQAPVSPVSISPPRVGIQEPEAASIRETRFEDYESGGMEGRRSFSVPVLQSPPLEDDFQSMNIQDGATRPMNGSVQAMRDAQQQQQHSRESSLSRDEEGSSSMVESHEGLQYHAFDSEPSKRRTSPKRSTHLPTQSIGSDSTGSTGPRSSQLHVPRSGLSRPASAYTLGSEYRGRTLSPLSAEGSPSGSPHRSSRDASAARRSPLNRPVSYLDLLSNVPYHQQIAPAPMNNHSLQSAVGNAASLLNTKKTLEMYRANVKKTNDAAVQYEFALFMVNASRDVSPASDGIEPAELISEAKHILQRLSDRAYPFAQYYLGDGYFSGLFNKDKPDHDKAFMLFVAASKHGHAEAGYRAALCYEFGWGTTKSPIKAVNFYRASASKNHPGAATRLGLACIRGDLGLHGRERAREGVKWLKRATESADAQYNSAPFELGLLHLTGFGDDIFKDEAYAAQLFTQSADLGHAEANFALGAAYENGFYGCPRDAALSVHFYNGAATAQPGSASAGVGGRGIARDPVPEAMMALCAWYMVGAEPVLPKDEVEAYAWARQAAEMGFPKAEYAIGYFTEMGIGCRRDPLEANVWYVRAADHGNVNARQRLEIIRAATSGFAPSNNDTSSNGISASGAGVGGAGSARQQSPAGMMSGAGATPMSKAEARSRELAGAAGSEGSSAGVGNGPGVGAKDGGKKKILGIF